MAKKKFNLNKRSRPMSEVVAEFEGKTETVDAVDIFEKNPTKENIDKAVEAVKKDTSITISKDELMGVLQALFVETFSSNIIPASYKDLKEEAKYLADLHQVSGLYMAQRLKVIRDRELFKEDGYLDFKSFIESELSITKKSVYNYIDIVEQFIECKRLHSKEEMNKLSHNKSKLIAYMPLLKSDKLSDKDKDKLRDDVLKKVETRSFRDLTADAKELKLEYGLTKPKSAVSKDKSLVSALENMYESVKRLRSPDANECFLLVLEHLEISKQITGKELGKLAAAFNKFEVKEVI